MVRCAARACVQPGLSLPVEGIGGWHDERGSMQRRAEEPDRRKRQRSRPLPPATSRSPCAKGEHAMTRRPIDVYLNDHLAGATFGADLARRLKTQTEGTDSHSAMSGLAADIEAGLDKLTDLMNHMGITRNPGKRVVAWVTEKASRLKLAGLTSKDTMLGTFLGIEALSLGVEGKAALWTTLRELRGDYPELSSSDLDQLVQRAKVQRQTLETERIAAARRSLTSDGDGDGDR